MRRASIIMTLGIAVFVVQDAARAGIRAKYEVIIDTTARAAFGSFGAARNSLDDKQSLECGHWVGAGGEAIFCGARDAGGTTRGCYVPAPDVPRFRAAVNSITDGSMIRFEWNAAGSCTFIQVHNASTHEPKAA